jgi:hypothetical protein
MQIDRPVADGAAAGQRHPRLAAARQDRPQHQHRGAHLAHQIVGGGGVGDPRRRQMPLARRTLALDAQLDAVLFQQLAHGGDVGQRRQVGQAQRLVGQQRRRHEGKGGILRAADLDSAL